MEEIKIKVISLDFNNMKQNRGELTQRIRDKSKELLGYEISTDELRLMVYVQYQMCNERYLKQEHISQDERVILDRWEEAGYITGNADVSLEITKEFWDIICEIIYLGYVDLNE